MLDEWMTMVNRQLGETNWSFNDLDNNKERNLRTIHQRAIYYFDNYLHNAVTDVAVCELSGISKSGC
jgi:hypothetical protein